MLIDWAFFIGCAYRNYERNQQVPCSHSPFHPSCVPPSSIVAVVVAAADASGALSSHRPELPCSGAQENFGRPAAVRDCAHL